jgi:hypothetical protein
MNFRFLVAIFTINYWVNIDSVLEPKLGAAAAHVSQWEPSINHYRSEWDPADLAKVKSCMLSKAVKKGGHVVEAYRIEEEFNNQWGQDSEQYGCTCSLRRPSRPQRTLSVVASVRRK